MKRPKWARACLPFARSLERFVTTLFYGAASGVELYERSFVRLSRMCIATQVMADFLVYGMHKAILEQWQRYFLICEAIPRFKWNGGVGRSRMPEFRQRTVWRCVLPGPLASSWTNSNFSFKITDWDGTCAITCNILTRSSGGEQVCLANCFKWLFANAAHPAGSSRTFSLIFP